MDSSDKWDGYRIVIVVWGWVDGVGVGLKISPNETMYDF